MNKKECLEILHELVSKNVIGDKQLFARYKGFRGELFAQEYLRNANYQLLNGGVIVSKSSKESSLEDAIYFNVAPAGNRDNYKGLFLSMLKLDFAKYYFVEYEKDSWEEQRVMSFDDHSYSFNIPRFKVYEFNSREHDYSLCSDGVDSILGNFESVTSRGKNRYPINDATKSWLIANLARFEIDDLIDLLMSRVIFDGYIGFSKNKGKPSDIDFVIDLPSKFVFLEVKEKDLPKKAKKGFGLDIPRIRDLSTIQKKTGLEYHVMIRHINNQIQREFLEWRFVTIDDFIHDVKNAQKVEGGTGMRSSYSSNPTLICSIEKFNVDPTF